MASNIPVPVPIRTPFIGLPMASPSGKPARMQMVRKHPPARVDRGMAGQWQTLAANANFNMVNAALTTFIGGPET